MSATVENTAPAAVLPTMTIKIGDSNVELACQYHAGYVMNADDATLADTARARQFANNQNALWQARKSGKNKTPQPTSAELAKLFIGYMPNIGDGPTKSAVEKMREEAAWRFWTDHATRHNAGVRKYLATPADKRPADAKPIHAKAGWKEIPLTFTATYELGADGQPVLENGKKKVVQTAAERKDDFVQRLLGTEAFKAAIEKEFAKVQAERGKESAAPAVERATVDDLL